MEIYYNRMHTARVGLGRRTVENVVLAAPTVCGRPQGKQHGASSVKAVPLFNLDLCDAIRDGTFDEARCKGRAVGDAAVGLAVSMQERSHAVKMRPTRGRDR